MRHWMAVVALIVAFVSLVGAQPAQKPPAATSAVAADEKAPVLTAEQKTMILSQITQEQQLMLALYQIQDRLRQVQEQRPAIEAQVTKGWPAGWKLDWNTVTAKPPEKPPTSPKE